MTPRTKKFAINLSAIVGALIGVGGWAVRSSARAIDARYVHTESFALRHQRDSLSYDAQFARIDTSLAALVRACQKRGECP